MHRSDVVERIGPVGVIAIGVRKGAIRDIAGRVSPVVSAWTRAFGDRNDLCQSGRGSYCGHSFAFQRRGSRSQTRCRFAASTKWLSSFAYFG